MSEHEKQPQTDEQARDPEAPDPAGNPADHTGPRSNPDTDPKRMEQAAEDRERTIAT